MIPATKQAAALRFLAMATDPKKLAKSAETFKSAHGVDLMEAYSEARRTLETAPQTTPAETWTVQQFRTDGEWHAVKSFETRAQAEKWAGGGSGWRVVSAHTEASHDVSPATKGA